MISCKFLDLQNEEKNPYHQAQLDVDTLNEVFEFSKHLDPYVCEFIHSNGYRLTVGLGSELGCAQFSSTDGQPPYLLALSDPSLSDEECEEFLLGGTATEISKRHCLDINSLKKIIYSFCQTGEKPTDIVWEEI
jgi:Immunity protein Imm1